jgi:hypothetical protein
MTKPAADKRSAKRRARDAAIAAEPKLPIPALPPKTVFASVETHLRRRGRHPVAVAVAGVVENGVVRPLDPAVKLPEHARVIIVAAEGE